jgi:putative transposase
MTHHPTATICRILGIGRATAYRPGKERQRRYRRREDPVVYAQLREVLRERGSYGYRRARVLVNRAYSSRYNRKRIQRVMRMTGLALPIRGRRHNRRAHRGRVVQEVSNRRWCSDGFDIPCWNGDVVSVAFALDCCDREVIAYVARVRDLTGDDIRRLMRRAVFARFGPGKPPVPIQWLTDNGPVYTALDTVIAAEALNLTPITTPVASPESNGMAEAFVNTMRRDYIDGADLSTGARVIEQLPGWMEDYDSFAPHSGLGDRSPTEYRRELVST